MQVTIGNLVQLVAMAMFVWEMVRMHRHWRAWTVSDSLYDLHLATNRLCWAVLWLVWYLVVK